MKLKNTLFFLILFVCAPIFSNGVMSGSKKVIYTKYFDVIYSSGSEQSAKIVSSNIDSIYEEICNELNETTWLHMPVTITKSVDDLNAYFSSYPYNRIVLYDTLPAESLSVFSNTLLSVLYHELVHAVTYNVKNPSFKFIGRIWGDAVSPVVLNAPPSVAEGAAVLLESSFSESEGRLNNAFSTHVVRQAKIDNAFPSWQEVTGARDIYPVGECPYIFGGMFYSYVRQTYGNEKYAQFWRRLVNDFNLTFYSGIFEEVFGDSIEKAWNAWYESIDISGLSNSKSIKTGTELPTETFNFNKRILYSSLTSSVSAENKRVAWIDDYTDSVWIWNCKESSEPKKIFTQQGISKIKLSADGKFLAFSYTNPRNYKNFSGIYSFDTKKTQVCKTSGLRESVFFRDESGMPFFAAVKVESQTAKINFYKINESKNKLKIENNIFYSIDFSEFLSNSEKNLGKTFMPFSLTDCGSGNFAWILKDGMENSICIFNFETKQINRYYIPSENLKNLNIEFASAIVPKAFASGQNGILISFCYSANNSLPRLGYFALNLQTNSNALFYLQNDELSGGVYYPVALPLSKSQQLPDTIYIARFFDSKKLLTLSGDETEFSRYVAKQDSLLPIEQMRMESDTTERLSATTAQLSPSISSTMSEKQLLLDNSSSYHIYKYLLRGFLMPLSSVTFWDESLEETGSAILGLTYLTSNPWMGTTFVLSGGYNVDDKLGGSSLTISGGTNSESFAYSLTGQGIFDSDGLYQFTSNAQISSSIPVGKYSAITFADTANLLNGHPFKDKDDKKYYYTAEKFLSATNTAQVQFSTVHKTKAGYYSYSGVFVGPQLKSEYIKLESTGQSASYHNLGFNAGFNLPNILPFENSQNKTLNLPLETSFSVLPKAGTFAGVESELTLFSLEVQKGFALLLPFYLQRFTFKTYYSGDVKYTDYDSWDITRMSTLCDDFVDNKMDYYDSIGLCSDFYLAFNSGSAVSAPTRLRFFAEYPLRKESDDEKIKLGIKALILL